MMLTMNSVDIIAINLFIISYIFIALFRTSRSESSWVKAIKKRLDPVIEPLGLHQFWGMFAPEPHHSNNSFVAHITFVSDPPVTWTLANDELSSINRKLKTRRVIFEKHALENKKIQESVRDYLIRKYHQQEKQVKEIKLIGYFQEASGVALSEQEHQPKVVILATYCINISEQA